MKTNLKQYKVTDIVDGAVYNGFEGKGLFGLLGKVIEPAILILVLIGTDSTGNIIYIR